MCPSHVKPGKAALRPAAFRSKGGTDDVSVMRHTHLGSDFCKRKAKEIANDKSAYAGLAWLSAGHIRLAKSKIIDSRSEFCGHAHIEHGMMVPPGEPPESDAFIAITERCQELVKLTRYLPDAQPNSDTWTGSPIGV